MFDNSSFDHWLTQKSQEIVSKMDKEKLTSEDMLVLTLKAQTNHFHHMDVEFRGEFSSLKQQFRDFQQEVHQKFEEVRQKFGEVHQKFTEVHQEFEKVRQEFTNVRQEFRQEFSNIRQEAKEFRYEIDRRFEQIDKRFDRLSTILMWGFGLMFTSIIGIYIKLAML